MISNLSVKAEVDAGTEQIRQWMREAGMLTWQDAVGNVHGRIDGALSRSDGWSCVLCGVHMKQHLLQVEGFDILGAAGSGPDAPVLLIGSHYDTVYDAGQYDGAMGIIVGAQLACRAQPLHRAASAPPPAP
jgi:allantoate deiminase